MELMVKIMVVLLLIICSYQDMKEKQVSVWIIALGAIVISLCVPFVDPFVFTDRILGMLLGGCVVGISKITRGKIGMADGYILCATGIGLGLRDNIQLFVYGLFIAAIFSIILLVLRKVTRKHSIPFVPFLLLGYLVIFFEPLFVK